MTTYRSINPHAPDDVVAEVRFTEPEGVEERAAHARAAAPGWARMPAAERGRLISDIGQRLADGAEDFARLVTREVGKPITEARGEVQRAVSIHRYYAQVALLSNGESYPAGVPDAWVVVRRYPVGVCGLITPWNFPIAIPAWKAVPALVYGNTVVLKPSPEASETARRYHEIADAVLPQDVFQLVLGDADAGAALVASEAVDAISFTGSIDVGRAVAQRVAARGARFQGELSGHNPSIVLADADLDAAAKTIAAAAMGYAGQKCTATGRVIVEAPVYDAFRERFIDQVSSLTLMDPLSDACDVGPLIGNEARVSALTALEGLDGDLLVGGRPSDGAPGFYLEPAVVELADSARAAEREIFAPVALMTRAENALRAIDQANEGNYGLVAAVFTASIGRALAFADRLKVGLMRVNSPTAGVDFHVPFGGAKASGMGPREQGLAAREFYTEPRSVLLAPDAPIDDRPTAAPGP